MTEQSSDADLRRCGLVFFCYGKEHGILQKFSVAEGRIGLQSQLFFFCKILKRWIVQANVKLDLIAGNLGSKTRSKLLQISQRKIGNADLEDFACLFSFEEFFEGLEIVFEVCRSMKQDLIEIFGFEIFQSRFKPLFHLSISKILACELVRLIIWDIIKPNFARELELVSRDSGLMNRNCNLAFILINSSGIDMTIADF